MSALSQADDHFQAQLADQRGQAIMHEQGRFALQESGQQHQEYMAKLQSDLSNTQLNQAEDIRRQRLERQVEYIQANSGEGRPYSAEDGRNMITQLRTGLDPLQERLRRSQQVHVELQNQQMLDQTARLATIQGENDKFRATALPTGTVQIPDPNNPGQILRVGTPDGRGGYDWHEAQPRGGRGAQAEGAMSTQTYNQIHDHVEQQVDRIVNAPNFSVPSTYPTIPGESAEARKDRYREDQVRRRVNDRVNRMGGGNAPPDTASFDTMQSQVIDNPRLHGPLGMQALAAIREARGLFLQARGNVDSLPPEAKARYLALNQQIQERIRQGTGQQPAPRDEADIGLGRGRPIRGSQPFDSGGGFGGMW